MPASQDRAVRIVLALVVVLAAGIASAADAPPAKAPVPNAEAQTQALKLIKDLFKEDYAKEKSTDRKLLAAKLLDQAKETKDDPAARFVLYREASLLNAQAGDLTAAFQVVGDVAKEFVVEPVALKAAALEAAVVPATTPAGNKALAESALALLDDALTLDDPAVAGRILAVAEGTAKKSQTVALIGKVAAKAKELKDRQAELEKVEAARKTLKDKPDDPAANLAVGKSLAVRGNWEEGLPLLAKSDDAKIKALAAKELAKPATAQGQVDVADGWYDLAQAEKGRTKAQILRHAHIWYETALPSLTGLSKTKVEKRQKEIVALLPDLKPAAEPVGEVRRFGGLENPTRDAAIAPDGKTVLTVGHDKSVRLWDLLTGKEIRQLQGHTEEALSVAYSPDGNQALSGGRDGVVRLWDLATGKEVRQFKGRPGAITCVTFSPDGRRVLAAMSDDKQAVVWDAASGKELRTFGGYSIAVRSAFYSPDSRLVLVGSWDKTVRIFDVESSKEVKRFQGGGNADAVFSPKGQFCAFVVEHDVQLVDYGTGKELGRLSGHTDQVDGLAISPDGARVLTASRDRTVRLWDVKTGKELEHFRGPSSAWNVRFSKDGHYGISAHGNEGKGNAEDNVAILWRLPE